MPRKENARAIRTSAGVEKRGWFWIVGFFLICPCHLPLTLWLVGLLLSGTAAAVLVGEHPYIAGAIITVAWVAGTWRGIHLLRVSRRLQRATT